MVEVRCQATIKTKISVSSVPPQAYSQALLFISRLQATLAAYFGCLDRLVDSLQAGVVDEYHLLQNWHVTDFHLIISLRGLMFIAAYVVPMSVCIHSCVHT